MVIFWVVGLGCLSAMKRLLFGLVLVGFCALSAGRFEFNNIKCVVLDKDFCGFGHCLLKSVNRTYKYLSLKVNLFKIPITNVTVHVSVFKKANGYKPFLYSITFDACKFMKSRKDILVNFFFSIFEPYTNMNHTCPYDHDLVVEKLPISYMNSRFTEKLPLPEGDYMIFTSWMAYRVPRANVSVYFTLG